MRWNNLGRFRVRGFAALAAVSLATTTFAVDDAVRAALNPPPIEDAENGATLGVWSGPFSWGMPGDLMVPIHATLVPWTDPATGEITGKVFTFGNYGNPDHYLWDTETGAFELLDDIYPIPVGRQCSFPTPVTNADLFCSGHSLLPDGRVLITGGNLQASDLECDLVGAHDGGSFAFAGAKFTHVLDPNAATQAEQFTRLDDMRDGRWYPSNVTLGDGRVLVMSGYGECSFCAPGSNEPAVFINPDVEIFTPNANGGGTWSVHGQHPLPLYPNLYLMTDGRVFYGGPGSDSQIYDPPPNGTGFWSLVGFSDYPFRGGGSFVPVPGFPDKFMLIGGGCCVAESSPTVEQINLNDAPPQWEQMAPLNQGREYADAVILPDRTIVVVGGRANTWENAIGDPVFEAELFDPHDPSGTPTWQTLASAVFPRMYHSTALLLPNGSVWTAGGTAEGPWGDQFTAEIFFPPYMFAGDRPVIDAAPTRIAYDEAFRVSVADVNDVSSVVLVRPGSTTHAVNMEQRLVDLSFTVDASSNQLIVQGPLDGNHAPPGYYMMFIADDRRVPSEAKWVRLRTPACPDCVGDMNCDGVISVSDIGAFVVALTDPANYATLFPDCDITNADTNADGFVTVSDIGGFVVLLVK